MFATRHSSGRMYILVWCRKRASGYTKWKLIKPYERAAQDESADNEVDDLAGPGGPISNRIKLSKVWF